MISVIVPALNEEEQIAATLRSLASQSLEKESYEIIVVDGGSDDGTVEIAEEYADRVTVQTHPGIGGARRDGAEVASGRIIAFTDADTAFPNGWLEVISQNLERHEASTGPVIFQDKDLRTEILRAWRSSYKLLKAFNFCYMIGSNMAMRRETYRRTGGHRDISLLDDYDLSVKLFKIGADAVYDPDQAVYTSSRRAHKLLTYGVTVAYGHYNYAVTKDYDKLLNYPKVDDMTVKDVLNGIRWGKNVVTAVETVQSTLKR
jgi:glycosyltransferase involved in cell wall biosynthesis